MAGRKHSLTTWLRTGSPERPELPAGVPQRVSLALEQFVPSLCDVEHPALLDTGCVWQSTVSFFTRRGCKIYTEDLFQALDLALREKRPKQPPLAERFLPQVLNYSEESFRGVLAWDLFDYLPDELIEPVAVRFCRLLEPGGVLLGLFHDQREHHSFTRYRVRDHRTLELLPASLLLQPQRSFANRALLRLFSGFSSTRNFLGRDNLRELLLAK